MRLVYPENQRARLCTLQDEHKVHSNTYMFSRLGTYLASGRLCLLLGLGLPEQAIQWDGYTP